MIAKSTLVQTSGNCSARGQETPMLAPTQNYLYARSFPICAPFQSRNLEI